jgi:hypothetical protein
MNKQPHPFRHCQPSESFNFLTVPASIILISTTSTANEQPPLDQKTKKIDLQTITQLQRFSLQDLCFQNHAGFLISIATIEHFSAEALENSVTIVELQEKISQQPTAAPPVTHITPWVSESNHEL